MTNYQSILDTILADARYQRNLDWGAPRKGHPEGSIRAHIAELERNLAVLQSKLSNDECSRIRILIHTHDTFKPNARQGVPITHPESHASLARQFLAEFCEDNDLLAMIQYHDEPYALWQQVRSKGACNKERFQLLLQNITDWNLFLAFNVIDGCTAGKGREPLQWLFGAVDGLVESNFTARDIL
ncbi:MAG: hypothetical protein R3C18_00620 [Planctomycetaceae bacterium]